jgi:serine/threonine-protein kinase
MGEVYRAYDARLDRSVAVKLIRPEASADGVARERFRREARAAAGLSHPSIVQIYDIVESGEGDAIVMELVEGDLLSQRIAQGPLEIAECVRLASQVADGLAAAHRRGILHRDLKAENLLITPEGHAKILDFGLAKRVMDESEASLTRTGGVVGTLRVMSPEQARGLPLGPQSDLFSFGVLLYEMLTGQSPFRADAATDTLVRVCTARQTPVRELRPGVPAGISDLVDRLLEKDPMLRPRGAREVIAELGAPDESRAAEASEEPTLGFMPVADAAPHQRSRARLPTSWQKAVIGGAALLLLAALGLAGWALSRPAKEPLYLAVAKPEITTGSSAEVSLLAASLRLALLKGLLSLDRVFVLPPDQVDEVSGSPVRIARAMAANEVVTSRLECRPAVCHITLSRIAGRNGSLLGVQSFEAPIDQPYLLAEAVGGHLRQAYADRRPREDAGPLEVKKEDYSEYLRLRQEFDSKRANLPLATLLEGTARLRGSSPQFVEAYVFESDLFRYRFFARRDPQDLEQAFILLERARKTAPWDPRPLFALFETALAGERLERAEEALRALEGLSPGEPEVSVQRARLTERRGDPKRALALMRAAVAQRPSWKNLIRLADMEYRLGESSAARRDLTELLDRLPGHYQAQSLLAQIELLNGSPQRAAEIYQSLVQLSPQMPELTNLGTAYMLLRRYPESRAIFERVLRQDPENSSLLLNLADVCYLGNDREQARVFYLKILAANGRDPAAANWQLLSIRAQALAHLGRRREAVETTQQSLALAPGNAQALQEAAQVYMLVGDQASALVYAERALREGVEPGWFGFPWFDSLRASPEFAEMLRESVRRGQDPAK